MRDYVDELIERNLAMIPKGVRAKECCKWFIVARPANSTANEGCGEMSRV